MIREDTFQSCTSLTDVYYGGSQAGWRGISSNLQLNATIHYGMKEDTCGDNLSWKLEGGTLTISGSGPMYNYGDFTDAGIPAWASQEIQKVVIEPGVTNVGAYAFNSCNSLKEVVISDSVTDIRARAFAMCSELERVVTGTDEEERIFGADGPSDTVGEMGRGNPAVLL